MAMHRTTPVGSPSVPGASALPEWSNGRVPRVTCGAPAEPRDGVRAARLASM